MDQVEVTFKPTDKMPIYQGTCRVTDPVTAKEHKPLLIIKEPGTYTMPREKAAQLCHDFPNNFSCSQKLDWTDHQLAGGTIHMVPGGGIPGVGKQTKAEGAPAKVK